jgi:hypothetical protein
MDGLEGGQVTAAREKEKADAIAAPRLELFDLKNDPFEQINLAEAEPGKLRELRARLDEYTKAAAPSKQAPAPADFKVPDVWGEW